MNPTHKNILLVNLSKRWGGGEKWFFVTGKALVKEGWNISYLVYPNSELQQKLNAENLPYQTIKLRFLSLLNPAIFLKLWSILKRTTPTFILLNASHELKTAGWLGKWMGVPHVILRRGLSFPFKANIINRFFVSRAMNVFLTNSQDSFDNFVKAFPHIKTIPSAVIRNGVDTHFYKPELQSRGQICIASRLSKEKGIPLALEAINKLTDLDIQLHIWGEGPEKDRLDQMIKELGLQDMVNLHGFEPNLHEKMAHCSIFLLPSIHGEGTSNSLIEAMSLGLPAIAFDVASMRETIHDGDTGFVIPGGNTEALAEKIMTLVQNESLRKKMGNAARLRCLKIYSQAKATENLSRWLLSLPSMQE